MIDEAEERIYFMDPAAVNIELFVLEDGDIALHGLSLCESPDTARAVAMGLLALCSGQFDRAICEETYRFNLAVRAVRQARRASQSESASGRSMSAPNHTPDLGDL